MAPLILDVSRLGQVASLKYLFQHYRELFSHDICVKAISEAAANDHVDAVQFFLDDCSAILVRVRPLIINKTLYAAVQCGQAEMVKYLFSIGADVHFKETEHDNLLDAALRCRDMDGHVEVVKLLRERGLAATKPKTYFNHCLLDAISFTNCHESYFQALIELGADVNDRTDHDAPLFAAIEKGNLIAVRCLLKNGASVKLLNRNGDTVLHHACHLGNKKIIRLLLLYHANGFAVNLQGLLPIEVIANRVDLHKEDKQSQIELLINADENMSPEALTLYAIRNNNTNLILILNDLQLLKLDTALRTACEYGSYRMLKCIESIGLDLYPFNRSAIGGVQPFIIAYHKGNLEAMRFLVERGVRVHTGCEKIHCLVYVLRRGDIKTACAIVDLEESNISKGLLNKTSRDNQNPIRHAQLLVIEAVLLMREIESRGADPQERYKIFGLFEVGDTRDSKVNAAIERLNALLEYNDCDRLATTKVLSPSHRR